MWTNASFLISAVGITCCLLLGGATSTGFLTDALLQLISIPLLLAALGRLPAAPTLKHMRWPLLFVLAVVLVPLVQLIPLPPRVWTVLPGRETVVASFELLERELPWMPISLAPQATWLSALSLLPPTAIFITTSLHSYRERRLLSLVVLAVGAISVFVGLSQVAQGPASGLRFFEVTNPSEAVGFFANRNHFAALLYALTLLAAAWAVATAASRDLRHGRDTSWILAIAASFVLLVVLVAAQAMTRSRAGIGLTIVALLGAFALALRNRRDGSTRPTRLLVSAIALGSIFAIQFALYRVLQRFAVDPLQDARIPLAENTIAAAKAFMPFGSGMGTFVPVYAMFESPQDALVDAFANRAHNDFLELWLEAGVAGLALIAVFLMWFVIAAVKVWRQNAQANDSDQVIARAATLIVALLVVHSFVDYPLRTGAMMAVLAFACALLVAPPVPTEEVVSPEEQRIPGAHRGLPAAAPPLHQGAPGPASRRSPERWGANLKWPDEWRHVDKDRDG